MRRTAKRTGWWSVALALLGASVACGSKMESAWETDLQSQQQAQSGQAQQEAGGEAADPRAALLAEAEAAWKARGEQGKVEEAIAKWEKALEMNRADAETWSKLSRAYYFLADCHLRFDESAEDRMAPTFDEGRKAAEKALSALSPEFARRMVDGERIEEAIRVLDRRAVPALYWRSANMGKWASYEGFATLLAYKDEVKAIMQWCLEQDESFYYGGPHRYFGAYFARIPAMAGRDLNKSKEHFEKSLRFEPNYFATRVLYAQDYAVNAQDRATFDAQIEYVLGHDPNVLPDAAPENVCEQRKARALKERAEEVFE